MQATVCHETAPIGSLPFELSIKQKKWKIAYQNGFSGHVNSTLNPLDVNHGWDTPTLNGWPWMGYLVGHGWDTFDCLSSWDNFHIINMNLMGFQSRK